MHVILRWNPDPGNDWKGIAVFSSSDRRTLDNPHFPPGRALPAPVRQAVEKILAAPKVPRAERDEWTDFSLGQNRFSVTTITSQGQLDVVI